MKTRPAQPRDTQRYIELRDSSKSHQAVMALAAKFYANAQGGSWVGLEAEAEAHGKACREWNEELTAAGFALGHTGLRVIMVPRG